MVLSWCRWFRGVVDAGSVELFDHLYISRRNRHNDLFRIFHFIRGSFLTNTYIVLTDPKLIQGAY